MPAALVRLPISGTGSVRAANEMTAQSVAGLAAKAVNEGRNDEMVWIATDNVDVEDWLVRLRRRHPQLRVEGNANLWDLVELYAKQGLIKGYILYRSAFSPNQANPSGHNIDDSVNVATSLAGLLDGIIVDETLEPQAKAHGLTLLLDVREKSQAWCFKTYRPQFNRRLLCIQDPRKPNVRDLAIARQALTIYGHDEPLPSAMEWLQPLSPILGWNGGDEFQNTELSTRYGDFQSATDWCVNLPVLMAGAATAQTSKLPSFEPKTINWSDRRSAVSFVSSDGDNVQWLEGSFFRAGGGKSYWSNPDRGKMPFGWSCCFAQLAQLCPYAIDYAAATKLPNDSFIEWGGGYYYPDLFGSARSNRWELLAQHARQTWSWMKQNNTRIIGVCVSDYKSPDARKAYEVFAKQTAGLLAILVFQYSHYEEGAGDAFWVEDRNGIEVPVITARYNIWNHENDRPRTGTPAKIAREIRQTVEQTPAAALPRYDWVICHVWSYFRKVPGSDENAENMPQENAASSGGECGYSPALWCAQRLPATIRVVSPEELIWRIRMQHNPSQTKQLINQFQ